MPGSLNRVPRRHASKGDSSGSGPRGRRDGELTIDELAAQTGMTVRNVRAYSSRGLLPPPRLAGRTGFYGPEHVSRLTLVHEMLEQGYTLSAAEKLITAAPGSGTQALGLYHALMRPWRELEPDVIEPRMIARQAGIAHDPALVSSFVELGLAHELPDGRLRIDNPALLRAGLEVIALGVDPAAVIELVPRLREHADAVSELFINLFREALWDDFVDAGMPAAQWGQMQHTVEQVIPLAGHALLAAFQDSLGQAVDAAMKERLGGSVSAAPPPDEVSQTS